MQQEKSPLAFKDPLGTCKETAMQAGEQSRAKHCSRRMKSKAFSLCISRCFKNSKPSWKTNAIFCLFKDTEPIGGITIRPVPCQSQVFQANRAFPEDYSALASEALQHAPGEDKPSARCRDSFTALQKPMPSFYFLL